MVSPSDTVSAQCLSQMTSPGSLSNTTTSDCSVSTVPARWLSQMSSTTDSRIQHIWQFCLNCVGKRCRGRVFLRVAFSNTDCQSSCWPRLSHTRHPLCCRCDGPSSCVVASVVQVTPALLSVWLLANAALSDSVTIPAAVQLLAVREAPG